MLLHVSTRKQDANERRCFAVVKCKRVGAGRELQRHVPYIGEDQVLAGAGMASSAAFARVACPVNK